MPRLTEKYAPRRLSEFVGLAEPRKVLGKWLGAPYPTAFLFIGPSGNGKTRAAEAIARALGIEPDSENAIFSYSYLPSRKCNLEAINELEVTCKTVPWSSSGWRVIHIAEADQMTAAAQIALLSVLDTIPAKTVFILTCNGRIKDGVVETDSGALEPRFLSRLTPIHFSTYGLNGEGKILLSRIWRTEAPDLPELNFTKILAESRNNIRAAIQVIERELLEAAQ